MQNDIDEHVKKYIVNLAKLEVPIEKIAAAVELPSNVIEDALSKEHISISDPKLMRKMRQAKGIAAAKARGVRFGRPKIKTPENFEKIVLAWETKKIDFDTALLMSGMKEATFYRRLKEYRNKRLHRKKTCQ